MPPDIWCGKAESRVSGAGMPTWASSSIVRLRRSARVPPSCTFSVSMIWKPTVKQGLRLVIGSWKIMAMSLPMIRRRARAERPSRSVPAKIKRSAVTRPGQGISPMTASMLTLLPEPDSPTTPTISPESSVMSRPSTARKAPRWVWKSTDKLRISSSATRVPASALQFRIERIAQPVAQKVEREHGHEDGDAGEIHDPGRAQEEFPGVGHHGPPFGGRRLGAEAEEPEGGGVEDRRRDP